MIILNFEEETACQYYLSSQYDSAKYMLDSIHVYLRH